MLADVVALIVATMCENPLSAASSIVTTAGAGAASSTARVQSVILLLVASPAATPVKLKDASTAGVNIAETLAMPMVTTIRRTN